MRQKGSGMKQLNIPITIVVISIILVIGITSVNVLVVHNYMEDLVEESLDTELVALKNDLDESLSRMKTKGEAVDELAMSSTSEKDLMDALNNIGKNSALYDNFYVLADGTVYDENGNINPEGFDFSDIPKVKTFLFQDNYYSYCTVMKGEKPEDNTCWAFGVFRDFNENQEVEGYFVIAADLKKFVSAESFEMLDENGFACIMAEDGTVYDASPKYRQNMNPDNQFYNELLEWTDHSASSKNRIVQMERYLKANKTYTISCKGQDGKQIRVRGLKVDNTEGLFLTMVFDNGIKDARLLPVMLVCFISSMLIIMTLFWIILLQMMVNYRNLSRMEEIAYTDEVTDGYNLNYFKFKAPELIATNLESRYVIMRFDIANFRYLNEAYGHIKADEILKSIAEQFDVVYSKKELCARINSDQFIALILNEADFEEKNRKFEKIIGDMAKENGVKYPIRFKKGLYQVRKEDMSVDIMIDHANAARKSLKGDEKILEALYSETIIQDMKKNDAIVSEMQPALERNEFKPYLQPKWDIVKDKIVGAELLVRWIRQDGTMVYPSDFIPIFEQNGFIEKLDFFMLESLCKNLKEYKASGKYNLVPVSINQSRILLSNPEYLKNVERVMSRYDTAIEDIQVEITESVFFNDREKMIDVIDQLKEMGLVLCMDDFGSGYSSLNLLKDVPFDILKIDKDFFSETVTSRDTMIIMNHIVGMAEELGIEVVCEGVETEAQIEMLKQIGCHIVQGYYYGKPVTVEEFVDRFLLKDEYKKPEKSEPVKADGESANQKEISVVNKEKPESKAEEKPEEKPEEKTE